MHKYVAIVCIGVCFLDAFAATSRAETESDLVNFVIDVDRANEKELGAVAALLRWTILPDESAKKLPDKIVGELGNGGRIEFEIAKERSSSTLPLLLDVNFFECIRRDAKGNLAELSRLENGRWTEFQPSMNRLMLRSPDQLAHVGPTDPRQLATDRQGQYLTDVLATDKIAKAERFDDEAFGPNSIRIQLRNGSTFEFASNSRFLPVHRCRADDQGHVFNDLYIRYQPSGRGKSLLLKSATTKDSPRAAKPGELDIFFRGKTVLSIDEFELLTSDELEQRKFALPTGLLNRDLLRERD